jgi:hypothetical protein
VAGSSSDCGAGYACTWANNNYDPGIIWTHYLNNSAKIGLANDTANSVAAHGTVNCVRFYWDVNNTGDSITFRRPAIGGIYRDPALSNGGGAYGNTTLNWENRISSILWVAC